MALPQTIAGTTVQSIFAPKPEFVFTVLQVLCWFYLLRIGLLVLDNFFTSDIISFISYL